MYLYERLHEVRLNLLCRFEIDLIMIRRLTILLLIVGCEEATDSISPYPQLEQEDCAGVAGGTAIEDECGVCGGGGYSVAKLFNLDFTIIAREVTNSALIVQGNVKYLGSSMVGYPWYIEGDFYSDNSYTMIIGSESELIEGLLESGVTSNWTLPVSSNDLIESEYPNFGFKNLAGYILTCP